MQLQHLFEQLDLDSPEYKELCWSLDLLLKKVGTYTVGAKRRSVYIDLPNDPKINVDEIYNMVMSPPFEEVLDSFDLVYSDNNFHSALRAGRSEFYIELNSKT